MSIFIWHQYWKRDWRNARSDGKTREKM